MNDNTNNPASEENNEIKVGRRDLFVKGGALTAGVSLLGLPGLPKLFGAAKNTKDTDDEMRLPVSPVATPGVKADVSRSKKPLYIADAGVTNLAAVAVAETLFWTDIMMEHASIYSLLLAGDKLANERIQAKKFQKLFENVFLYVYKNAWTEENLNQLVKEVLPRVERLVQFKETLRIRQEKGELQSLGWPTFYEHTRDEGQHFIKRLNSIGQGNLTLLDDQSNAFWVDKMADHMEFIAHFLDPEEKALIQKATQQANNLHSLVSDANVTSASALQELNAEVIDFKTAAQKGIDEATIKSIIQPSLADHVLREALKFSNELARAQ